MHRIEMEWRVMGHLGRSEDPHAFAAAGTAPICWRSSMLSNLGVHHLRHRSPRWAAWVLLLAARDAPRGRCAWV